MTYLRMAELRRTTEARQAEWIDAALRVIATIDSPAEAAQARCIAVQRSPMQRAVN